MLILNSVKESVERPGVVVSRCLLADFGYSINLEVFTVPPHSTWNPYGFHVSIWIPYGFHPFHMEYFWVMFQPFQDVRSTWNPHGMTMEWPNYRWNDGISIWNPHGMTMEYHENSIWNDHGIRNNPPNSPL